MWRSGKENTRLFLMLVYRTLGIGCISFRFFVGFI